MFPNSVARRILDNYVIIGAVHGHMSAAGVMGFDDITALRASDASGTDLKLLSGDEIPPAINGAVSTMTSFFGRALGLLAKECTGSYSTRAR